MNRVSQLKFCVTTGLLEFKGDLGSEDPLIWNKVIDIEVILFNFYDTIHHI